MSWRAASRYYKQLQAKLDRIALICREGLSGARVVRAFVREGHKRERLPKPPTTRPIPLRRGGQAFVDSQPRHVLVMNLGVCAILWVGGIQVNVGGAYAGPGYGVRQLHDADAHLHRVRRQPGRGLYQGERQRVSASTKVLNCVPSITDEDNEPVALLSRANWRAALCSGLRAEL